MLGTQRWVADCGVLPSSPTTNRLSLCLLRSRESTLHTYHQTSPLKPAPTSRHSVPCEPTSTHHGHAARKIARATPHLDVRERVCESRGLRMTWRERQISLLRLDLLQVPPLQPPSLLPESHTPQHFSSSQRPPSNPSPTFPPPSTTQPALYRPNCRLSQPMASCQPAHLVACKYLR